MSIDETAGLARVHDRIDELSREVNIGMTEVKVGLARLEAAMPKRPCPELVELRRDHEKHLGDHEKNRERGWQFFLKLATPASIGAAAAWLIGRP